MSETYTRPLWYFAGDNAECDKCVGMSSHYSAQPPKPHPQTCNCEILVEFVEGKNEYRNLQESHNLHDAEGLARRTFKNPLFANLGIKEEITVTMTGDIDCNEDIEEAFDVSGKYVAEHTFTETFEYSLPPNQTVTVQAIGTFEEATLSCDVWFVGESNGKKVEAFLHKASDTVKSPMLMRLEVD